jgi:uncharacterized RDD family membrane protein YckC
MNDERLPVLRIRTPEGVVFSFRLASPFIRLLAWFIDQAVIFAVWSIVSVLVALLQIMSADFGRAFEIVAFFGLSIGYGIACEWYWRGQTLGKHLLHLRVVDERGLRLNFAQVMLRNLLRAIDSLPLAYLVGGIAALVNPRGQRLGDLAAGTIVVWEPIVTAPDWNLLGAGKYNSLRAYPHVAARMRREAAPDEARAGLQAVLRRDIFDPEARVHLFSELAAHFKALTPVPPEAVDGITDEQFVRNVVEVLYSAGAAVPRGSPVQPEELRDIAIQKRLQQDATNHRLNGSGGGKRDQPGSDSSLAPPAR